MARARRLSTAALAATFAQFALPVVAKAIFTTIDPPGSGATMPQSINASGAIAGYYFDGADEEHSFVGAADGGIVAFDPPGSQSSTATGINARGDVIGIHDCAGFLGFIRSKAGKCQSFAVPQATTGTFPRHQQPWRRHRLLCGRAGCQAWLRTNAMT